MSTLNMNMNMFMSELSQTLKSLLFTLASVFFFSFFAVTNGEIEIVSEKEREGGEIKKVIQKLNIGHKSSTKKVD